MITFKKDIIQKYIPQIYHQNKKNNLTVNISIFILISGKSLQILSREEAVCALVRCPDVSFFGSEKSLPKLRGVISVVSNRTILILFTTFQPYLSATRTILFLLFKAFKTQTLRCVSIADSISYLSTNLLLKEHQFLPSLLSSNWVLFL